MDTGKKKTVDFVKDGHIDFDRHRRDLNLDKSSLLEKHFMKKGSGVAAGKKGMLGPADREADIIPPAAENLVWS